MFEQANNLYKTARMSLRQICVLAVISMASASAVGQSLFYAGLAGGGEGNPNPGAFATVTVPAGSVTIVGTTNPTGGGVSGLATDGSVIYASISGGGGAAQLVTVNPATGAIINNIGNIVLAGGGICSIGDLTMSSGGVLFGITANSQGHVCDGNSAGTIVTINTSTGEATPLGRPMEVLYDATNVNGGLAFDGAGNLWLSPGWNHPDIGNIYRLSTTTGLVVQTLALSGTFPTGEGANGLAWNPDDGLLYASFEQDIATQNAIWTINPSTGVSALLVADTGYPLHDMLYAGAVTPPPPSPSATSIPIMPFGLLLLTGGVLALLGMQQVRRIDRS